MLQLFLFQKNAPTKVTFILSCFVLAIFANLRFAMILHLDADNSHLVAGEEACLALAAPAVFAWYLFFLK